MDNHNKKIGEKIYSLAKLMWKYNRSITGEGVLKTLEQLKKICPLLKIKKVPSGTKAFDWKVPLEWKVNGAYVIDPKGKKILDFSKNNLHLVGYSVPTSKTLNFKDFNKKLYSLPKQPTAIPYITTYYNKDWGFCISHNERKKLKKGSYKIKIDTKLFRGNLNYGEIIIKGKSKKEIFLSTYICHPSMANNELSGPTLTIYLAKWLQSKKNLNYTYRIIFIPETIGSIAYLSKNLKYMKKNTYAGFNITCVGDSRTYSYLPSRNGNTISDLIAKHVLKWTYKNFKYYSWNERGSDERQYCAPGIDLPIATIMRSKYGCYPEYHTSLDKLGTVVTTKGLGGSYEVFTKVLNAIEKNFYPKYKILGEPHLSKRNLYPTLSSKENYNNQNTKLLMNLLTYSDGTKSLLEIADICDVPIWDLYLLSEILIKLKLIKKN